MSQYNFKAEQRFAVYAVHGPNCYICKQPVVYKTMHVDHVIPETLIAQPERLKKALADLGLPASFEINSYHNWLPAHADCNQRKGSAVFEPSHLVRMDLNKAGNDAGLAAQIATRTLADHKITAALLTLEKAAADGMLDDDAITTLAEYFERLNPALFVMVQRQSQQPPIQLETKLKIDTGASAELLLTSRQSVALSAGTEPTLVATSGTERTLVATSKGVIVLRFPNQTPNCPYCNENGPWSGSRCLSCGQISDPDC